MAKAKNQTLLLAGGGVAAFAAYEFLFKPWLAAKNAAPAGAGILPTLFSPPSTSSLVSSPTSAFAPGGVQGSIVDPRITPGGDVGQAMWKKNWTQQQASTRLSALKSAYANAVQQIAAAKSTTTANPAAAGIPAAQQQLAVLQSAISNADAQAAANRAAGDLAGAAKWEGAAASHRQDAAQIQQRIIAASQAPAVDPAALAAWEGAAAGFKADYFALTGMNIPGS